MKRYIKITYTLTRDLDNDTFQRLVDEDTIILDEDGNVDHVEDWIEEEMFHSDDLEFDEAEIIEYTTQDIKGE